MFFVPAAYLERFSAQSRFHATERQLDDYASDLITSVDFPDEEPLAIVPLRVRGELGLLYIPWHYRFLPQDLAVVQRKNDFQLVEADACRDLSVEELLALPLLAPRAMKAIQRDYAVLFDPALPVLRVKYQDFWTASRVRALDLPLIPRYRTKISAVVPTQRRASLPEYRQALLGISLGNAQGPAKTICMGDWIERRFDACRVLVGDSIHRLTLQILERCDETDARQRALQMGQVYMRRTRALFERFADCRFDYVFTSQLEEHENFQPHLRQLARASEQNSDFDAFVKRFVEVFVARNHMDDAHGALSVRLSRLYLLEELAMLACLIEDGWPVLLYPGSLGSAQIAPHGFSGLPAPLQSLVSVSLQLRRRN